MVWVGRDLTDHLVPTPCHGQGPLPPAKVAHNPVLSNLALYTARERTATASLGNLAQGLTILRVKNFFLISDLNLPSFSLKPLPLVLLLVHHFVYFSLRAYKMFITLWIGRSRDQILHQLTPFLQIAV